MLDYLYESEKNTFFTQLLEVYSNLMKGDTNKKLKDSYEVFDMLQKSYSDQGGVHGSGFESAEDMVHKIPMWKLHKKDGKIKAVSLYKNVDEKGFGRKMVAMGTDGSPKGKAMLSDDLRLNRAHTELSGKALSHIKKHTNLTKHLKTFDEAKAYHSARGDEISRPEADDPEVARHPELKDHFYSRKIGDKIHTKLLLGTMGKTIK